MLDQVEKRLLSPVDIVEHHHQWLTLRLLLQEQPEGPGNLIRSRGRSPLAKEGLHGSIGVWVGRRALNLLDHLDHRPVGDPLAVRKAATADDARAVVERA